MITLADIQAAQARIRDGVRATPALHSEILSREAGNQLFLKLENLHVTGSFKERGALNALLQLSAEERSRGVVAASAGNHAQAVAYHAGRLGTRAEICMPLYTPMFKVAATRGWGAEVILHGENFDQALAEARRRAADCGLTFLHAFNQPAVIAGQGTTGLELLDQVPDLEAVVVPVGGGGLIGGIACAVKQTRPEVRVIGVEPAAMPSMQAALDAGEPVEIPANATIADGVAVQRAGDQTLALAQAYVDELVTVEEESIARAILYLLEKQKTLAEGAGALGVAAMLEKRTTLEGRRVAVLISGGNIDVTLLANIIERGLVKDARLIRLRVTLPDHPGSLEKLARAIASQHGNIVHVVHDRAYFGVSLGHAKIDVTVETRGRQHAEQLTRGLREAGFVFTRVK